MIFIPRHKDKQEFVGDRQSEGGGCAWRYGSIAGRETGCGRALSQPLRGTEINARWLGPNRLDGRLEMRLGSQRRPDRANQVRSCTSCPKAMRKHERKDFK